MSNRTIIFIQNGQDPRSHFTPDGLTAPSLFPPNNISFVAEGASRVTWSFKLHWASIKNANGVALPWELRVRTLAGVASTAGPQHSSPERYPFDALKTVTDIAEGVPFHHPEIEPLAAAGDWNVIASNVLPNVFLSRTIDVTEYTHFLEFDMLIEGVTWDLSTAVDPRAIFNLTATTHEN